MSSSPLITGARITGVDDKTYSSTGESFSAILLPNSESNAKTELQADDVSLAYEVICAPDPRTPFATRCSQSYPFLLAVLEKISWIVSAAWATLNPPTLPTLFSS